MYRIHEMNDIADTKTLTTLDFAIAFGTSVDDIPTECRKLIDSTDFHYRKLKPEERDRVILDILKKIESGNLKKSGEKRKPDWEIGWSENLDAFQRDYSINSLIPKFLRSDQPVRLNMDYVWPYAPNFELNYCKVFRLWLFKKFFKDASEIYEFGCGTGYHLAALAEVYPEKKLHGLDWAISSQKILRLFTQKYGWHIKGHRFDFFSPDKNLKLGQNSAIFTLGALEQIGSNHEPFIRFLLEKSPSICINVECLNELYDGGNLFDYLALLYHKQRNYLNGYLSRLKELEAEGKIEIFKIKRLFFGCLYHEVYSYIIWKPKQ